MNADNKNSLMYDIIEHMDYMVRIMDQNGVMIYMNQKMREQFGDKIGLQCFELFSSGCKCTDCVSERCRIGEAAQSKNEKIGDKIYRVIASPVYMDHGEAFSVEIFEDVTEQIKIQEENQKNYEKLKSDVEFAKQIQIRALPENGTHSDLLRVDSCYRPSEALGGDIFDVVTLDQDRVLFYIADILGHGIRASLLTIFLRQVIRGLKENTGDLNAILDALLLNYREMHSDNELYFSILMGLYNKKEKSVSFLNAGHNCLPLIVRAGGQADEVTVTGMPVCSLLQKTEHRIVTVPVERYDRIFLYTDGVTEVYNEEKKSYFGLEGMRNVIAAGEPRAACGDRSLAERIVENASRFSTRENADDMAVFVAQIL